MFQQHSQSPARQDSDLEEIRALVGEWIVLGSGFLAALAVIFGMTIAG